MDKPSAGAPPIQNPHEERVPSAAAGTRDSSGSLWPDYRAYFTVGRLLTVAFGLIVMEVGAWVALRVLPKNLGDLQRVVSGPGRVAERTLKDSFLGFRLRPGVEMTYECEGRQVHVQTVSHGLGNVGFRDLGMKPPFDIVALGDSFTYCDDISPEHCWLRLLGENTGLSVADLGVPGYSTMQSARMLERYGSRLRPRIVLVTAFGNDFKDNDLFDTWLRSGSHDFPKWRAGTRRRGVIGDTLARHSVVFRIALAARRASSRQMETYKDDTLDLAFKFDPWWIRMTKQAEASPGFHLMQEALMTMQAQADQMGATLVVLLLPTKEEVYWDISRKYVDEEIDVDRPRFLIREFCEKQGLKCCDFTKVLRANARDGQQLYLRVSGHWNEAGNALAADITAQCLRENGLLAASPPHRMRPNQSDDGQ